MASTTSPRQSATVVLEPAAQAFAEATAGPPFLYGGAIHDFMMVNALRETNAAGAAIAQTASFLKTALEG